MNNIKLKCLNCQNSLEINNENGSVRCEECNWITEVMPKSTFLKLLQDSELTSDQGTPFSDLDPITYKQQPHDDSHSIFSYPSLKKEDLGILREKAKVTAESIEIFIKQGKSALSDTESSRLRQFLSNTSEQKLKKLLRYYQAKLNAYKFLNNSRS